MSPRRCIAVVVTLLALMPAARGADTAADNARANQDAALAWGGGSRGSRNFTRGLPVVPFRRATARENPPLPRRGS